MTMGALIRSSLVGASPAILVYVLSWIALFPVALTCRAQSSAPKDDTPHDTNARAGHPTPASEIAPLTDREREMLQLIKGLQDRVSKLEAQLASESNSANPTPRLHRVTRLASPANVETASAPTKVDATSPNSSDERHQPGGRGHKRS